MSQSMRQVLVSGALSAPGISQGTSTSGLPLGSHSGSITPVHPLESAFEGIEIEEGLKRILVGRDEIISRIIPYLHVWKAGLCDVDRPVGVFLLLGPTGSGKTYTPEALAEILHGSPLSLLRIDCGEFQMEHEVAKLIGAPPGYLGHRETAAAITQEKLQKVQSPRHLISIIVFDEIEKAAPSLSRLLLGVLDKARMTLGDNSIVNFSNSLIFMTSNIDVKKRRGIGYEGYKGKLEDATRLAIGRQFSQEFINRVDEVLIYEAFTSGEAKEVLMRVIEKLLAKAAARIGIEFSQEVFPFLVAEGLSKEYGARYLKRIVMNRIVRPLALLLIREPSTTKVKFELQNREIVILSEKEG